MKLLVFGKACDAIRKSEIEIFNIKSTDELKEYLAKDFPGLETNSYALAVNKKIIHSNIILTEEDVIALLPPYSGG